MKSSTVIVFHLVLKDAIGIIFISMALFQRNGRSARETFRHEVGYAVTDRIFQSRSSRATGRFSCMQIYNVIRLTHNEFYRKFDRMAKLSKSQ